MGETSLWAFVFYGIGGLLFEALHDSLRSQFFLMRGLVYLLVFWAIEYLGGWLVLRITGKMLWDYSKSPGGSLHGLIRWNFAPVWPLVGLGVEPVHDLLVQLTPIILQTLR